MRLPEAKIKEAVVHPEKLVRQEALLYFADCYSRDAEVMPLAIQATEDQTGTAAWRYWPACGPGDDTQAPCRVWRAIECAVFDHACQNILQPVAMAGGRIPWRIVEPPTPVFPEVGAPRRASESVENGQE